MDKTWDKNSHFEGMEALIEVSQELSLAKTLGEVATITRKAARELCAADGATFILKEGNLCHYADEDAISPLWKGKKFPLEQCISGWSILHRKAVVIEDIYQDQRIPHEAYRPTFVKSLVMVPIREKNPIGAIGNYWAKNYEAPEKCVMLLRSLANLTAIALENVGLIQELKAANHALESTVHARDAFLSVASHELRTPLSSLKLQLQMLGRGIVPEQQKVPPAEKLKSAVDLSLRQVESLGSLVENLLDVSRIRLKRLELDLSEFDFSDAVHAAVAPYLASLSSFKCEVALELQKGIVGRWDRLKIERIVAHLVSNVCKYAQGAPLRISTQNDRGMAVLVIEDGGPGIKKDHQRRIFERYERVAELEHSSGLGLGLFLAQKLVELHHGKISLESEGGQGAKFILEFPIQDPIQGTWNS